jgi:hypothetical protein
LAVGADIDEALERTRAVAAAIRIEMAEG